MAAYPHRRIVHSNLSGYRQTELPLMRFRLEKVCIAWCVCRRNNLPKIVAFKTSLKAALFEDAPLSRSEQTPTQRV
jgi:hypothetical protein